MNKNKQVYVVRSIGKENNTVPILPAVFLDSEKAHDYLCKLVAMFPSYHFELTLAFLYD